MAVSILGTLGAADVLTGVLFRNGMVNKDILPSLATHNKVLLAYAF
jgi:hypothetical protein